MISKHLDEIIDTLEFYASKKNHAGVTLEITKVCPKKKTVIVTEKFEVGKAYTYASPVVLDAGKRARKILALIKSKKTKETT